MLRAGPPLQPLGISGNRVLGVVPDLVVRGLAMTLGLGDALGKRQREVAPLGHPLDFGPFPDVLLLGSPFPARPSKIVSLG